MILKEKENGKDDKEEKEYIFTGSSDKTIKQWVLDSNELLYTFPCIETEAKKNAFENMATALTGPGAKKNQQGHKQGVCCLAVSKGFLYSGSFDSRIIKWDLKSKQQISEFLGHQEAVYRISMQDVWLLSGVKAVRIIYETS